MDDVPAQIKTIRDDSFSCLTSADRVAGLLQSAASCRTEYDTTDPAAFLQMTIRRIDDRIRVSRSDPAFPDTDTASFHISSLPLSFIFDSNETENETDDRQDQQDMRRIQYAVFKINNSMHLPPVEEHI
jgi:hypothetical protein